MAEGRGTEEMERGHAQWEETQSILHCDGFLHHVNRYCNWEANSHQIVRHQCRPCIKPLPLASLTSAYGNLMAPKLVRKLEDEDFHIRLKALAWAVELLATPDGRVQCFAAGMIPTLARRLSEKDMFMRQLLAQAFKHIAGMQDGCIEMSCLGMIKGLLEMIASGNEKLRETAFDALHQSSYCETVRLELVNGDKTLQFMMQKIMEVNCEPCKVIGLKILQRCAAGGLDQKAIGQLLEADAVSGLLDLIKIPNQDVQEAALRLLCLLGMNNKGKEEVVRKLGINSLLHFINGDNQFLQISAAAALMSVTVDIEAKKAFVDGHGTVSLLPILDSESQMLSLNALQLATNVAEHQVGRKGLEGGISIVENILSRPKSNTHKRFACSSLQQLKFDHRPFT